MNDKLKYTFDNINQWLQFAEKKNAILIAFNATLLFGIHRINDITQSESILVNLYYYSFVLFIMLSAIISIISFIPKFTIPWLSSNFKSLKTINMLYWGDLAKLDKENYIEILGIESKDLTKFDIDLLEQILINSRIAKRKFLLFNYSVWLIVCSIFTPILSYIIYLIFIKND